jgi:hypothetical protein
MTYVNHRATENTKATRRFEGFVQTQLCASSVFSVSQWLAYVN